MKLKLFVFPALVLVLFVMNACAKAGPRTIPIAQQGSFAVGGTVVTSPGVFDATAQAPAGTPPSPPGRPCTVITPTSSTRYRRRPRLPMVMWHGIGQFSKTWETTPDGREGYQTIFLRRRFGVYLVDQPRRGRAGRSTVDGTIPATPDEQNWFATFRLGIWPDFFPGVQFSRDPEALNQYFRQMTPNVGPIDVDVNAAAIAALFDKIGPGILVTHSHSGGMGWRTAISNQNVRAIVSYEPGSGFVFPEGEVPPPVPSSSGPLAAVGIPVAEFMALTKIPIVIYYGDYIPEKQIANAGQDGWRARLEMARLWRDAVNKRGGDVTVVHLPEVGIRGNTHFPFSDLNNVQVADVMSEWLRKKGLDK